MSKDLEMEYRALVKSEVPDLWSRIEAGLDEKEDSDKERKKNHIIGKVFHVKIWVTVAAACVCVGLIIPVMKGRMTSMSGSRSDTAAPADFTANNAESYELTGSLKAEGTDIRRDDLGGSVDSDSMNNISNNVVTAEGAAYDGGEALEEAAEERYTFRTEIQIIDADVRMDSKIVYTARILSSENLDLQKDSEIRIAVSAAADNDVFLEKGKTYELTLCEDDSGEELTYSIVN